VRAFIGVIAFLVLCTMQIPSAMAVDPSLERGFALLDDAIKSVSHEQLEHCAFSSGPGVPLPDGAKVAACGNDDPGVGLLCPVAVKKPQESFICDYSATARSTLEAQTGAVAKSFLQIAKDQNFTLQAKISGTRDSVELHVHAPDNSARNCVDRYIKTNAAYVVFGAVFQSGKVTLHFPAGGLNGWGDLATQVNNTSEKYHALTDGPHHLCLSLPHRGDLACGPNAPKLPTEVPGTTPSTPVRTPSE
jgi:hypothetical protein